MKDAQVKRGTYWKGRTNVLYRYSAFIVLYPPGLISEAWLVYLALTDTSAAVALPYRIYLALGLLTYIPGKSRRRTSFVRFAGLILWYSELHHVFAHVVPTTTYVEAGQV